MVECAVGGLSVDPDLAGMSRRERLEQLRRRMAAVPARGESVSTRQVRMDGVAERPVLPVPTALAGLLPGGGLPRGSVVTVTGSGSLLVGLLAAVTGSGGHAAVIGHPRLGLLAAAEMGADLGRLAMIPNPGPDPVEVAAVLLDGLDLVVLGLGGLAVPPSRARAVVARARSKGATLVVTGGRWSGAEIRLDATVRGYDGLGDGGVGDSATGRGCARLRGLRLAVGAEGRAFRRRTACVDLRPNRGRVEWVPESIAPQQVTALQWLTSADTA
ncbi:hypothetical protein ACFYVR_10395 [Rhodococcus sp. NPDC003318]|uniref:hypothetical protein n=1 Tax=Rhodococcus sp. NPDC003318 TaxID=3364503 RepID=UPI00367C28EE